MAKTTSGSPTSGEKVDSIDEGGEDRNADRRDGRSLAQALNRALEELAVEPHLRKGILDDLKTLVPRSHRMSRDADVIARLTNLLERDEKARPNLLLGSTGANLDIAFEGALRSQERLLDTFQTDEDLLRAFVAIERLRAAKARELEEYDGIRRVLVAELARRYTLAEQWRYKMPQFMDPVIAVLQVAGVHRDALRPGKETLLNKIIELVANESPHLKGGQEVLKSAARLAYGRFKVVDDDPPPVDRNLPPIFTPDKLDPWPEKLADMIPKARELPRSSGLSRSTGEPPFAKWEPITHRPPYCFMGFRLQPDLSEREGVEGFVEPADLARLEMPPGPYQGQIVRGISPILGQPHPLMLPPHSSLAWYGQQLKWSTEKIAAIEAFGSPASPKNITRNGDARLLIDAFREEARSRIFQLRVIEPGHFLSLPDNEQERSEAAEDLARWWLFILVARHLQRDADALFEGHFYHGIHAPDFTVTASGDANFGNEERAAYVLIKASELRDADPVAVRTAVKNSTPYSGLRRETPA